VSAFIYKQQELFESRTFSRNDSGKTLANW